MSSACHAVVATAMSVLVRCGDTRMLVRGLQLLVPYPFDFDTHA